MDVGKVLSHIDSHWDEHLEATRAFCRQPSISGEGVGMDETVAILKAKIESLGGKAEVAETDGWPVVYGELDAGAKHTLLLYSMYDVQPVVGEDWLVPPFAGEIIDFPPYGRCLVNRGVTNQKGPTAGIFNVLEAFKRETGTFPVNIRFAIEGEEELGSVHFPQFVERYKDRLKVCESAFFPMYNQQPDGKVVMRMGVKGIVYGELVCKGGDWGGPTVRMVHGSNAVWYASPTWRLVHALASMFSDDQHHITIDGFYDDVVPPSADDEELLRSLAPTFDETVNLKQDDLRKFKYDLKGVDLLRKYLYQPTLNIDGIISGHTTAGTKTVLPNEARAKVDVRLVPNMTPEKVIAQIRAHLKKHGFDEVEYVVNEGYGPAKTSHKSKVAQALIDSLTELGHPPEIWPHLGGSAPFHVFTNTLGIPFAFGGLGKGGRAHSPNEWANVDSMRDFEKSMAVFLGKLGE